MTALLIVAVLAVAGFVAYKISKSKPEVSENQAVFVEPVKEEQPKVEAVVAPKKELKLKEKKQPVVEKKKEEKPVKTQSAKPKAKKTNKKDK